MGWIWHWCLECCLRSGYNWWECAETEDRDRASRTCKLEGQRWELRSPNKKVAMLFCGIRGLSLLREDWKGTVRLPLRNYTGKKPKALTHGSNSGLEFEYYSLYLLLSLCSLATTDGFKDRLSVQQSSRPASSRKLSDTHFLYLKGFTVCTTWSDT